MPRSWLGTAQIVQRPGAGGTNPVRERNPAMSSPTIIEIPHQLGRVEVRRRMATRIGDLHRHIPGGMATVESAWPSEDRMVVDVAAMGQKVTATLDVEDALVRISLLLPPSLSFMSGMISGIVRERAQDLLLEDKSR